MNKYWVPHRSAWQAPAWTGGSGVARMGCNEVWAARRVSYVAWQLYGRAFGNDPTSMNAAYDAAMTMLRTKTETYAMDNQLQAICAMAKGQDAVSYTHLDVYKRQIHCRTSSTSSPASFTNAPSRSMMAMILAPSSSEMNLAAW